MLIKTVCYTLLIVCYSTNICASSLSDIFQKGVSAFNQRQFAEAESYFVQANSMQAHCPEILFNIACCYTKNSKDDEAITLLYQVIDIKPDHVQAYITLIELLKKKNRTDEVENVSTKLLLHKPNDVKTHHFLAQKYKDKEQFDLSIEHYQQIIALEPNNLNILFELALVYTLIGETKKAINLYDHILEAHPNHIQIIYNKGYTLKMEGSCDEAIAAYKKVISLDEQYDAAHFALGMAYLGKGDYEQGWQQHERFLKQVGRNGDQLRTFLANGTAQGKTILLKPEGGLGDSINFVRYAQELKKYGFNVIVAVPNQLYTLFKSCPGIDTLLKIGSSFPPIDDHTTLMSIPAILYSHEHTLPPFKPYIFPDEKLIAYWGDYLKNDKKFKIGICWEASVYNDSSRPPVARRGMPLEALYILSEIEGVSFYSLQQLDGVEQLNNLPSYVKIHVFDEHFDNSNGNFMDTAAVMYHMDLILSVDTAIAHLAGAMGRPIWLMLPYATDWRWLAHQTRSPWYPTMRIFQQPKPFDWQSVVDALFWEIVKKVNHI